MNQDTVVDRGQDFEAQFEAFLSADLLRRCGVGYFLVCMACPQPAGVVFGGGIFFKYFILTIQTPSQSGIINLEYISLVNLIMDNETVKELIQKEKAKGKTILITSHIMQFVAEVADTIVYLLEK